MILDRLSKEKLYTVNEVTLRKREVQPRDFTGIMTITTKAIKKIMWAKINGEWFRVIFCEATESMYEHDSKPFYAWTSEYVIIAKERHTKPSRGAGIRYTSSTLYDVYYRKNFFDADEGNQFYKDLMRELHTNRRG